MRNSIKRTLLVLVFSLSLLSIMYINKTENSLDTLNQIELSEPNDDASLNSIGIAAVVFDKIYKVLRSDYINA